MMNVYDNLPERLLLQLHSEGSPWQHDSFCAGFEISQWRCTALAEHIIEWLPDYALKEDELNVNHGNIYVRLKEAAARVYSTKEYNKRGELGEIALHAICRDFFKTIPLAPRVFYKTASNDVVKSFDMAHVRYVDDSTFEIWLGESKFYKSGVSAISAAIKSVKEHIDAGFLNREKFILGPQISHTLPHADKIRKLLASQTSIDTLFKNAVFPVCIACDSDAVKTHKSHTTEYLQNVFGELAVLRERLDQSGLPSKIKMHLIYVPLESKDRIAKAFDKRLKGLNVED
ncbi:DUF1837 domain-containing protein [Burkholderia cenocepacia]|uniref:HamA C-terminal domain-containing protein n=1 Tax=Burkholderia cenocepacia TaxID=95486 RepID=UPI000F57CC92|nr:DUF1837 domain-containing protein [Burkholderia cenocepacia]RQV33561.1 DUF1837 domain-containing protein [Burkholderia cenocepacia]RQV34321.1 DUF1837 domain-containing protein [Burkholderia cenocepacia]RQV70162.1 DUF1837 domain-containing protein [Burkholderia cenocepacia]